MNLNIILNFTAILVLFGLLTSIDLNITIPKLTHGLMDEKDYLLTHNSIPLRAQAEFTATKFTSHNSILFVGDVLLSRNVEYLMKNKGKNYPFEGIKFSDLTTSSYIVGNFESSIPAVHIPTQALEMSFSVNSAYLSALKAAGFTHVSLANNHTLDHGADGYNNTIEQLNQAGVITFGNPQKISPKIVSYLKLKDKVVALIGIQTLNHSPSDKELKLLFSEVSKKSDFQIVYIHWGEEYVTINNSTQQKLANKLVSNGADLIIGHHPHVVQNIDLINGVPVFYSLGNYIFDQYFSSETQIGLMLKLDLTQDTIIDLIPVSSIGTLSQPHQMSTDAHREFLIKLSQISASELKEQILRGTIILNSRVATSSKIAMMN